MPSASRLLGRTQGRSPEDAVADAAPVLYGGEGRNPDGVTPFPPVGTDGDAVRGTFSRNGVPYAAVIDRLGLFSQDVGTENLAAPAALTGGAVVGRATASPVVLGDGDYAVLNFDVSGNLRTAGASQGASSGNATAATVGVANSVILAANAARRTVTVYNNTTGAGADTVYIQSGAVATVAAGFPIPPGCSITMESVEAINAISGTAGQDVRIYEETN